MTAADLLLRLRDLGVRVSVEGERLKVNAPKGVLTAALRDQLAEHKSALVAMLTSEDAPAGEIPRLQQAGALPLSLAQQRLWLVYALSDDNAAYNIPLHLRLRGALDVEALRWSLEQLIARHEALRTTFALRDDEPVQQVEDAPPFGLEVEDLTGAPEPLADAVRAARAHAAVGFALDRVPLLRARLLRIGVDDHVLSLVMPHLVGDGWSFAVIQHDLGALYAARVDGADAQLPALPIRYTDYADWQRRRYDRDGAALLAYWREQLDGLAPLVLPADRPRPRERSFAGGTRRMQLDRRLADELLALGRREACTPTMTLLAVYAALLHRYSGQDDIAIGMPTAGRDQPQTQGLVGFFMNMLVARADLSGAPSGRQLLRRVRDMCLGAYQHQDMPFEPLVAALRQDLDPSANPLFQVAFVYDEAGAPMRLGGLDVEPVETPHDTAKFDLTLAVRETAAGLVGELEYSADLFDAATVERMAAHLGELVAALVADPDRPVAQLPMLTVAERAQLADGAMTRTDDPRTDCVHRLVERCAADDPAAIALSDEVEQLSYAALNARANRIAHALLRRGARRGALIGVLMQRRVDMVAALLGVMKAGAAYVPLDAANPPERLAGMIEDAAMPVLITHAGMAAALSGGGAELLDLDAERDAVASMPADNPDVELGVDDTVYVIFTSGSTGRPKGVEIQHAALLNLIFWHRREYAVVAADRASLVAGLAFDATVWELWPYLTAGASVHLPGEDVRKVPEQLLEWLADQRVTLSFAPTPLAEAMLAEPMPAGLCLRALLTGGDRLNAPPPPALPFRLVNQYGPTESAVVATYCDVPADLQPGVAPPIGRPIDNVSAFVVDRHRQLVPVGVPGELWIGGASLARGYHARPELTAEKFIDSPFGDGRLYRTGDLVRWRADGQLDFLGRIDHQVKVRGFRIELGEIEQVLVAHSAVAECVVVAQSRAAGDVQLAAFAVPVAGAALDAAALRAHLARSLPDYMVPSSIEVLEALPLTPNGKIDRARLSERVAPATAAVAVPLRGAGEQRVAALWRSILEVEHVGREDNFFEIGGHSLHLVRLRAKLQAEFGEQLSVAEVFQHPTVAAMAQRLGVADAPRDRGDEAAAATPRPAPAQSAAVAVIGMAGRFPKAPDLDAFWQVLRDGVECGARFSEEELRASGIAERWLRDERYVPVRAVLDDVDRFDASFFGFSPKEAERTDPQVRLFLEAAYVALESAGYDPLRTPGAVGVYAGSAPNNYHRNNLLGNRAYVEAADAFDLALTDVSFLATRASYKLNLRGPAVEVYTACSTSLVAVVQACESVLTGQSDMALAGGVFVGVPQRVGHLYREGEIFSPDGRCRPFDSGAQGTFSGEGVGVVLLKRLDRAIEDGDPIRAVIAGAALNNDGANKVGFTAPSVEGQAAVIRAAQQAAGIDPSSIGYVECHGTATPLGDPIEVAALSKAFGESERQQYCALGSVKANIGHADTAAGVAGLIKAVLALEHEAIPPSPNFEEPNPEIDFAASPFYVADRLQPWSRGASPRRAAVSSFGIGGTNAHVVLEEAPASPARAAARPQHLVTLSAKTEAALDAYRQALAARLRAEPDLDPGEVAATTQRSRSGFEHRCFTVGADAVALAAALESGNARQLISGVRGAEHPPVAFMFPGQGAQYVGMGRELYEHAAVYRDAFDRCAALLTEPLGLDLREVVYPSEPAEEHTAQLSQTRVTQPAMFAVEYALAMLWESWGVRPAAVIGHSIGEYVAATLAGVFSLEDALRLVAERGRMMQELPAGDMLSVGLPEGEVQPLLNGELSLSAINGPSSCVVGGPRDAVAQLQEELARQDLPCRLLHTSHAFHSSMMEPMSAPFRAVVAGVQPAPAQLPCASTVTGEWIEPELWADADYWVRNLRDPVRFATGARTVLDNPELVLLEVGPGQTLSALVRQQGKRARGRAVVPSMRHPQDQQSDWQCLLTAVGRLWMAGVDIAWPQVHGREARRVPLPGYPFARKRYWIERDATPPGLAGGSLERKAAVADWFWAPSWQRAAAAVAADPPARTLVLAGDDPLSASVVEALRRVGEVTVARIGERFAATGEGEYTLRADVREDWDALWSAAGGGVDRVIHLWQVAASGASSLDALAEREARGFYALMLLGRVLAEAGDERPLRVEVVTRGLFDVCGETTSLPERALMLGPCRVIPAEQPNVRCRLVDLEVDPDASATVEELVREWGTAAQGVVALRRGLRWLPGAVPAPQAATDVPVWNREGVDAGAYLITGGVGGVGLALAELLAKAPRSALVLVSRRGLPPREEWDAWRAQHGDEDRTSRRMRRIGALEAAGVTVVLETADVQDAAAMRAVVQRCVDRFGRVRGVVHAAGTATGGLVANRTAAEAAHVLAPKVRGTLALDAALGDAPLEFFALCSSVTAVKGGVGSVDYTAANAFLDAFAHSARGRARRAVTINWDAWSEAGMAAEADVPAEMAAAHREVLAKGLSDEDGREVFVRAVHAGLPQLLVSTFDLPARLAADTVEDAESTAVANASGEEDGGHERPELATAYAPPSGEVEQAIASVVQSLLGVAQIGRDDDFFQLGFDSLIGHRMIARLKQKHGIALALRAVLESPNVAALAAQAQLVGGKPAAAESKPSLATPPVAADHPLFETRHTDDDGRLVWTSRLSPAQHWVLGEHRIHGEPVLVGTAYLELARAAFEQHAAASLAGGAAIELRSVFFLAPLSVPTDGEREVRTVLTVSEGAADFVVESEGADGELSEHATGQLVVGERGAQPRHDVQALRARCAERELEVASDELEQATGFMTLGPRWGSARRVWFGDQRRLTEMQLPASAVAEDRGYGLHPALLDVAVGFREESGAGMLPFAYERVVVRGAMTPTAFSFIEEQPSPAAGERRFDVVVVDQSGAELVRIEGYALRRADAAAAGEQAGGADSAESDEANVTLKITEPGLLEELAFVRGARRPPADGEVEIEVLATGLNFKDVLFALGLMPASDGGVPEIGLECAGRIARIGAGVTGFAVGDEVVALSSSSFSAYVTVPAAVVAAKPQALSVEAAATIPISFLTAYHALITLGRMQAGEKVLIHAAAGGVGLAAVQVAQWRGAEIYATAGSDAKRATLRAMGIEHVMNSRTTEFADRVMEATAGRGVDLVLNSLAGEFIAKGLAVLGPYGRFLELGAQDIFANTPIGLAPFANSLQFIAVMIGPRMPGFAESWRALAERFADGSFAPLPHEVFAATDAVRAFEHMAAAKHTGKVVVAMGGQQALRAVGGAARAP